MYFRTNQVANDVLCNPRGGFCGQSAMPKDFLLKGAGIKKDKDRQELPHLTTGKTSEKGTGIISRPARKMSFNESATACRLSFSPCLQVRTVYKTEGQKECNDIEESTLGLKDKSQISRDSEMSALTPPEKCCSRKYLQIERSNSWLLGNQVEPMSHSFCDKHEDTAQNQEESNVTNPLKQLKSSILIKKYCSTKENIQVKATGEKVRVPENQQETETEKRAIKLSRGESLESLRGASSGKDRERKAFETYRKNYGSRGGKNINALNCVLSRRSLLKNQTVEDEDYQEIDIEYLLKLKRVSSLSRVFDSSAIDVVAKENAVKTETSLPSIHGSQWNLKQRYVSELSFNPSTPVLREYTRIAQARAVDFSDASIENQLYIM